MLSLLFSSRKYAPVRERKRKEMKLMTPNKEDYIKQSKLVGGKDRNE